MYRRFRGLEQQQSDFKQSTKLKQQQMEVLIQQKQALEREIENLKGYKHQSLRSEEQLKLIQKQNLTLYNRFFLHSIDADQEAAFLSAVNEHTVAGDVLYMEFRCTLDADNDKVYGKDHYSSYGII